MTALNMFAIVILASIVAFASATPAPEPHKKFGGIGVAYPVAVPVAVPVHVVPVFHPVPVVAAPIYGGFYG